MVKLVSAKCPNCGASLKISKDEEKTKCEYCNNTIIVEDAIACFKLKVSGNVGVEGISTNAELIDAANELLDMNEYLKAKRKFLEFSEKCPDNYQGWLGLLICRTRNFTIKDNNIMFENDVNKYYEHFLRVAPDDIKEQYFETIDRYFDPEKYIRLENQEKMMKIKQELENKIKQDEELKKQMLKEKKLKKKQAEENFQHLLEENRKKKEELINAFNNKKAVFMESSSIKTFGVVGNKILELFLLAWNGFLYLIGGFLVLTFIISMSDNFVFGFFAAIFGLSLFKCFYSLFEKKFSFVKKKYIIIARFAIPFFALLLWMANVPTENNENDVNNEENTTNVVENNSNKSETNNNHNDIVSTDKSKKRVYYIKYNELGDLGKYMEFEKKNVIFYYLPAGEYKIEVTSLNETVCYLWIDYRNGYQNGNYGTAYDTKERLKFSKSSKSHTIIIDDSLHIYNSNDCDYKLTSIK